MTRDGDGRPVGVKALCGLNGVGAFLVSVYLLRFLAGGAILPAGLAGGLLAVTVAVTVGLWNTYTWGWELGVAYYGLAVLGNLYVVALVAGTLGEIADFTLPGLLLSVVSLGYLVAVRDAFG